MEQLKKKSKARKPNTDWHDKFIQALGRTRSIGQACKVVGVGRTTAYNHKEQFPDFAEAWEECTLTAIEDLEASALKRAIDGHEKAVFHGGAQVGGVIHYETSLTIYMLKCLKPDVYNIDVSATELLSADQTAQAVRVAIEAMKQTVPHDD